MPSETPQSIRIAPEDLIDAYERARRGAGVGDREWRLTVGQQLDVRRLVAAMRDRDGKAAVGAAIDVWVDYLAPVMAESGRAKHLLRDVIAKLLLEKLPQPISDPPGSADIPTDEERPPAPQGGFKELLVSIAGSVSNFLTGALVCVGLIGSLLYGIAPVQSPPSRSTSAAGAQNGTVTGLDASAEAAMHFYQDTWNVMLTAFADTAFVAGGVTPRRLAAVYAAYDPRLGSPDVLLANLLRTWPVPPDEPLTVGVPDPHAQMPAARPAIEQLDRQNVATLRRLAVEIASMQSGLPRVLFEDEQGRPKVLTAALPPPGQTQPPSIGPTVPVARPWPKAWLALSGAPLVAYFFFALATHRRKAKELANFWLAAERRALRKPRPLQGIKQASTPLLAAPPAPFVERRPLRALMRYRPVAGRNLDGPRSIAALMRQEGVAELVMKRVQRAVSYLVIVQRRQPHDHERLRIRQLFAHLADRGLPVVVYDYDHDPLLLKRAIAASGRERAEGVNGREETLALSTLRDLHADSRLILVTDGRDLVDRISGRVRADVVRALSFWLERMILTPVPVGDWGEVEFALSRDLDSPMGRTNEAAVADLAHGFRSSPHMPAYRIALGRAFSDAGAGRRLDAWWQATAEQFGRAASESRGSTISFDQRQLTTDLPPSPAAIDAIRQDLYRWLGARGYLWHAACAIYPQLRYDLTVHIGRVLRAGPHADAPALFRDTLEDRRVLDRMTSLPWFRTGRMPEWLRKDVLASLDPDSRQRAAAVVRDLFNGDSGPKGPLAIWWPRTGALAMPPDAVMANALANDAERSPATLAPKREKELVSAAGRRVLMWEAIDALTVGFAGIGLWYFAPDFEASPHALGAWFPVFSFASVCMLTLGLLLIVRRSSRGTLPLPPKRAFAEAPSMTESSTGPTSAS
ncbi:hypothetical protein [Bradyrhizobium diazoefficiens]|uniref:hypothetical protein n=1 Tax=Bradyrhizobium diazoefficiens TaxID=1355477 RepID=UPI0034996490